MRENGEQYGKRVPQMYSMRRSGSASPPPEPKKQAPAALQHQKTSRGHTRRSNPHSPASLQQLASSMQQLGTSFQQVARLVQHKQSPLRRLARLRALSPAPAGRAVSSRVDAKTPAEALGLLGVVSWPPANVASRLGEGPESAAGGRHRRASRRAVIAQETDGWKTGAGGCESGTNRPYRETDGCDLGANHPHPGRNRPFP